MLWLIALNLIAIDIDAGDAGEACGDLEEPAQQPRYPAQAPPSPVLPVRALTGVRWSQVSCGGPRCQVVVPGVRWSQVSGGSRCKVVVPGVK